MPTSESVRRLRDRLDSATSCGLQYLSELSLDDIRNVLEELERSDDKLRRAREAEAVEFLRGGAMALERGDKIDAQTIESWWGCADDLDRALRGDDR